MDGGLHILQVVLQASRHGVLYHDDVFELGRDPVPPIGRHGSIREWIQGALTATRWDPAGSF